MNYVKKEEAEERRLDATFVDEDFIMSSQHVVRDSIDETIESVVGNLSDSESYTKPTQIDTERIPFSEDLFAAQSAQTEVYAMNVEDSMLQATPLYQARTTIPETPSSFGRHAEGARYSLEAMDCIPETPRLSRLGGPLSQSQSCALTTGQAMRQPTGVLYGTDTQMADTQPAPFNYSLVAIESDTGMPQVIELDNSIGLDKYDENLLATNRASSFAGKSYKEILSSVLSDDSVSCGGYDSPVWSSPSPAKRYTAVNGKNLTGFKLLSGNSIGKGIHEPNDCLLVTPPPTISKGFQLLGANRNTQELSATYDVKSNNKVPTPSLAEVRRVKDKESPGDDEVMLGGASQERGQAVLKVMVDRLQDSLKASLPLPSNGNVVVDNAGTVRKEKRLWIPVDQAVGASDKGREEITGRVPVGQDVALEKEGNPEKEDDEPLLIELDESSVGVEEGKVCTYEPVVVDLEKSGRDKSVLIEENEGCDGRASLVPEKVKNDEREVVELEKENKNEKEGNGERLAAKPKQEVSNKTLSVKLEKWEAVKLEKKACNGAWSLKQEVEDSQREANVEREAVQIEEANGVTWCAAAQSGQAKYASGWEAEKDPEKAANGAGVREAVAAEELNGAGGCAAVEPEEQTDAFGGLPPRAAYVEAVHGARGREPLKGLQVHRNTQPEPSSPNQPTQHYNGSMAPGRVIEAEPTAPATSPHGDRGVEAGPTAPPGPPRGERGVEVEPAPPADPPNDEETVPEPQDEEDTYPSVVRSHFKFVLEVHCVVEVCEATNTVVEKEVVKVQERPPVAQRGFPEVWSESTDKSKRESMSSAGSVYSDKTGLPFALKPRMSMVSVQTSSTSTVEEAQQVNPPPSFNLSDIQPWKNDCLIPLACDEALARHIALGLAGSTASSLRELSSKGKKTPLSRLSLASKSLYHKAQMEASIEVVAKPLREELGEAKIAPEATPEERKQTDAKITPLEKSTPKRPCVRTKGEKKEMISSQAHELITVENMKLTPVETVGAPVAAPTPTVQDTLPVVKLPSFSELITTQGGANRDDVGRSNEKRNAAASPERDSDSIKPAKKPKLNEDEGSMEVRLPDATPGSARPVASGSAKRKVRKPVMNPCTPSPRSDPATPGPSSRPKGGRRTPAVSWSTTESDTTDSSKRLPFNSPGQSEVPVLAKGMKVFARWADRFCYSGVLVAETGNKWAVQFADGSLSHMTQVRIIPQTALRPGHTVQVSDGEGYEFGIIIAFVSNLRCKVEVDSVVKLVNIADLRLTTEQFKMVTNDLSCQLGTPKDNSFNVNPDNILSEKRRSATKPASARKSGDDGGRKRKAKRALSLEQPQAPTEIGFEFTPGLEMDETVISNMTPLAKAVPGKGTSKSRGKIAHEPDAAVVRKLGPIPKESSAIFKGMSFLLCFVKDNSRRPVKSRKQQSSNSDVSQSDSEDAYLYAKYHMFPFDEAHLRWQLTAGGGTVYDRFSSVPITEYPNTRLVTNRPNRSAKFLLCLVHSIPIVLHLHVMDACRNENVDEWKRKALDFAGWSAAFGHWLPRPPMLRDTFAGIRILIYSQSEDKEADSLFKSFWTVVVQQAGASVTETIDYAQVVVTDKSLPQEILETVAAIGSTAPSVVSVNWVVESVLHGRPLRQDQHASFRYDYASS